MAIKAQNVIISFTLHFTNKQEFNTLLDIRYKQTQFFLLVVLYEEEEQDLEPTVIFNPLKTAGGPALTQYLPSPEERPITPMRDKMIYGRELSSLDFKDGKLHMRWSEILCSLFHCKNA